MFIKTPTIVTLVIAIILSMIVEWQYVAISTKVGTVHDYHGLCNSGVGRPYADFVHQLRLLQDNGDTNTLARALRGADERSRDIYDVWLFDKRNAYLESTREILK